MSIRDKKAHLGVSQCTLSVHVSLDCLCGVVKYLDIHKEFIFWNSVCGGMHQESPYHFLSLDVTVDSAVSSHPLDPGALNTPIRTGVRCGDASLRRTPLGMEMQHSAVTQCRFLLLVMV